MLQQYIIHSSGNISNKSEYRQEAKGLQAKTMKESASRRSENSNLLIGCVVKLHVEATMKIRELQLCGNNSPIRGQYYTSTGK